MNRPKISVILINHNYGNYIAQAIESVLSQTYKNLELIVVDDGSTDNSAQVIEGYKDKIKFIKRTHKSGTCSVPRNTALKEATGEFIAFLDSDDAWNKHKLQNQVDYLERHKNIGLAYSDYEVIDSKSRLLSISGNRYFRRGPVEGWVFNEFVKRNFMQVSTVIVRRKVLDRVGFFDPELSRAEDYDLWLRISRHYKIGLIDKALAKNRRHPHNMTNSRISQAVVTMKVIHKIMHLCPEIRSEIPNILQGKFNELFGELYFYKALAHLEGEGAKKARWWFTKAIKYQPLRISLYVYYLISFLRRPALIPYIRSTKRLVYGLRSILY